MIEPRQPEPVGPTRLGLVASLAALALLVTACGSTPPREADIYHDPSLRAGTVAPNGEEEAELLSRLAELAEGEELALGGHRFQPDAPYHAASGRRCRSVRVRLADATEEHVRLACEAEGGWVFVPDVFGATP